MPMKQCPECSKPAGVRTLKCKCGHVYRASVQGVRKTPAPPSIPPPIPRPTPQAPPQADAQEVTPVKFTTTGDGLYGEPGDQRPLAIIRATKDDLIAWCEALATRPDGAFGLPCVTNGEKVFLTVQIVK